MDISGSGSIHITASRATIANQYDWFNCDPSAISSHKFMMTVTNNVEWDVWLYDDRCLGGHCSAQSHANERDQVSWIQGQRGRQVFRYYQ